MKSIEDATHPPHLFPHPKPLSCSTTVGAVPAVSAATSSAATTAPCYEPTSVLDLRCSPASASSAAPAASSVLCEDPSPLLPVDEWESMMWALADKDDSTCSSPPSLPLPPLPSAPNDFSHLLFSDLMNPSPPFPSSDLFPLVSADRSPHHHHRFLHMDSSTTANHPPHQQHQPSFDRLQLEQLIRAAECVDASDLSLAHAILARLNQQLLYPCGKPLQRAAFYFKEALDSLLFRPSSKMSAASAALDTVHKIGAYKAFSELSPIFQFAYFTANQAILETVDALPFVHVVDFDLGLGGQWPSLMQEIAIKSRGPSSASPSALRISAVVAEESVETRLTADILSAFARELGIRFQIEFVQLSDAIALAGAAAVNLSPAAFRQVDPAGLLRIVAQISPRITVFVDSECRRDAGGGATPSFRRNFIDGLEFYSVLLESLDAAAASGGAGEQMRRIERFLIRPRILRSVEAAGARMMPWRELLAGYGLVPIPFSEFTESQAECLLRRVQLKGFHVVKRQSSMMLCWQGRELVSTSAWRCC